MSPSIAIGIFGIIIVIGFIGEILFEYTKIPSILFLMAAGLLLGPIYHIFNQSVFLSFAPYLSTLVLVLIMFQGGIELDFLTVFKSSYLSIILIIIGLLLSIILVGGAFYVTDGGDLMQSLMLGVIVSCSSSTVIMPLLPNIDATEKSKTVIAIESTFNDAFAIIILIVLIEIAKNSSASFSIGGIALQTLYSFAVSALVAVVAGIIWYSLLKFLTNTKFAYSVTFAAMLVIVLIMHYIHGNGAIAILVFGIMMGNEDLLTKLKLNFFKMSIKNSVIKKFNHEFSFLIRTVFFVFLGVVVELTDVGVEFFIRLFVIILLIIISRYIAVSVIFKLSNLKKNPVPASDRTSVSTDNVEDVKKEKFFMLSMIGRALATAIMAYMPLNAGIHGTSKFPEYAFTVIIATNVLLTFGVWYGSHKYKKKKPEAEIITEVSS
ncbi:MAG: cation:proton antiporter [Deltaproteobacteria bacterium]|jgi:cell volume regulation protein A|nr:cation:proton antiporter [Deltaproteobacteria bacterium]